MAYTEELKQLKEKLQEELKHNMEMLDFYRSEAKRYELITDALESKIDGIDCELRGEINK